MLIIKHTNSIDLWVGVQFETLTFFTVSNPFYNYLLFIHLYYNYLLFIHLYYNYLLFIHLYYNYLLFIHLYYNYLLFIHLYICIWYYFFLICFACHLVWYHFNTNSIIEEVIYTNQHISHLVHFNYKCLYP
jgi:hypothetical protein